MTGTDVRNTDAGVCFSSAWIDLSYATFWAPSGSNPTAKCDPLAIWEKMVVAKGGREALHSIQSIVLSSETRGWHGLRQHRRSETLVFIGPGRWWSWAKGMGRVFGTVVIRYDSGRGFQEFTSDRSMGSGYKRPSPPEESIAGVGTTLLSYLLETRWMKPAPVNCAVSDGQVSVRARWLDRELEFFADDKSYLVREVIWRGKYRSTTLVFRDYRLVSGLQLPRRQVNMDEPGWKPQAELVFEVNPKIDPAIFNSPINARKGREQWRVR